MRTVYLLLLAVLLFAYGKVSAKVVKNSAGLTPLLGWLVGLAYFVLAPLTIMTLNGGYEIPFEWDIGSAWRKVDLTGTTFLVPYLVIWASLLSACLVIHLFHPPRKHSGANNYSLSRARLKRALWITIALSVLDWTVTIRSVGGVEAFLISHWYERGVDFAARFGDGFVLYQHLSAANQIIFTSAAGLYTSLGLKNRNTEWGFTALIILLLLLEVAMTGNRIYFAIYLLAFLVSCFLFSRKKVLVAMLAISPLLVLVFSAWGEVRHSLADLPESVAGYADESGSRQKVSSLMTVTEGNNVLLLFHIIEDYGNHYEYLGGVTYSRMMTSLIPRSIYPHKSKNFTEIMAERYLPNVLTSQNATVLGEMYANFGPLTLGLFPLFTFAVVALSHWVAQHERNYGLLPSVLFTLLVCVARVTLAESFVTLLICLFLISSLRLEHGLYVRADTRPTASPRALANAERLMRIDFAR